MPIRKRKNIVDVPARLVARQPERQPDQLPRSRAFEEHAFDLFLGHPGIPVGIYDAVLDHENGAVAVGSEIAPFHRHGIMFHVIAENHADQILVESGVVFPRRIQLSAVCVEPEGVHTFITVLVFAYAGEHVPRPAIVIHDLEELHPRQKAVMTKDLVLRPGQDAEHYILIFCYGVDQLNDHFLRRDGILPPNIFPIREECHRRKLFLVFAFKHKTSLPCKHPFNPHI